MSIERWHTSMRLPEFPTRWVIRYPDPVGAVIAVLAWTFLLAAGVRARRSSRLSMSSQLRAVGVTVAGLIASLLFGALAWMAYAAARPSPGMLEGYLVLTVMLGLVTVSAILARRKLPGQDGGAFGVVATWSLLALLTGLLVPGMGYLFGWPALVGALWLTAKSSKRLSVVEAWFTAVAASAFVVMAPAIDTFFQLAQPRPGNTDSQLIPFAGLSTALAFLVATLVAAAWPSGRAPQPASVRIESLQPTRR